MIERDCKFLFEFTLADPEQFIDMKAWLVEQACHYSYRVETNYYFHINSQGESFKYAVEFYDHDTAVLFKLTWM